MTGKFIVIEGTDGTGKGTQSQILATRLKDTGYEVEQFEYPRYGNVSAALVEKYLRGELGGLADVPPEVASMFYAWDRFQSKDAIADALRAGKIVISNRFVGSNLGHQGAKFADADARRKYFEWNLSTEFGYFGLPVPHLNLILHLPAAVAQKRVDQKAARSYIDGKKRDLHEADLDHLRRSEETYLQLAEIFPDKFRLLECVEDGRELTVDEVADRVWSIVERLLAKPGFRPLAEALH